MQHMIYSPNYDLFSCVAVIPVLSRAARGYQHLWPAFLFCLNRILVTRLIVELTAPVGLLNPPMLVRAVQLIL